MIWHYLYKQFLMLNNINILQTKLVYITIIKTI